MICASGPSSQYAVMTEVCEGPVSRTTTTVSLSRLTLATYPKLGSVSITSIRVDE